MADAPPPAPRHRLWSELLPDILHLISQKLTLIFDYISFRSVCRSWRSAADPQSLPPQSPLLMVPYDPGLYNAHIREFFSLDNRRLCKLDLPEALDTRCLAFNHGWLLVLPTHPSIFLLNPFTRARIPLPPFTTIPGAPPETSEEEDWQPENGLLSLSDDRIWSVRQAFVSSSPTAGDDCVVMVWLRTTRNFAFCRPRDKSWTEIDLDRVVFAMAYCDNNFYAIDSDRSIVTCDVSVSPPRVETIPLTFPLLPRCCGERFYLVGSAAGLLLVVWYKVVDSDDDDDGDDDDDEDDDDDNDDEDDDNDEDDDDDDGEYYFDVLKMMDADGAAPRWEEIDSLDGEALFLRNDQGYSVRATDCPGVRPNCIYCSDRFKEETIYMEGHHVTVFSMEDASFELIDCYPGNDHYWDNAGWLRPSLC